MSSTESCLIVKPFPKSHIMFLLSSIVTNLARSLFQKSAIYRYNRLEDNAAMINRTAVAVAATGDKGDNDAANPT